DRDREERRRPDAPAAQQEAPEEDRREQELEVQPQVDEQVDHGLVAQPSSPRPASTSSEPKSSKPAAASVAPSVAAVKRPWRRLYGRQMQTENRKRGSRL